MKLLKEKIKKIMIFLLSCSVAIEATGCGDKSWSMKDDTQTLPIGVYIYYTYLAYQNAYSEVEDYNKDDIFKYSIDGKSVEDWIVDKAKENTKNILATDAKLRELNVSVSEEEINSLKSSEDTTWTKYGAMLQSYGISKNSYDIAAVIANAKYEKLYDALYGDEGVRNFTDEEIISYFTQNYSSYSYIMKDITASGQNPDEGFSDDVVSEDVEDLEEVETSKEPDLESEDTESEERDEISENISNNDIANSVDVAESHRMSEDQLTNLETQFNEYVASINEGKANIESVAEQFKNTENLEESPLTTKTEKTEDLTLDKELKEKFDTLGNNEAGFVKTETAYYVICRNDINDRVSELSETQTEEQKEEISETDLEIGEVETENESTTNDIYSADTGSKTITKEQVTNALKADDLKSTLSATAEALPIVINDKAIKKYNPMMFQTSTKKK